MDFEIQRTLEVLLPDVAKQVARGKFDPRKATKRFTEACKAAYWHRKDIQEFVDLSLLGIAFHMSLANNLLDDGFNLYQDLMTSAKQLAYNLGSYTWPGWDEPGIILEDRHLRTGTDAALLNLRIAIELKKGDLPMARGAWLIGAHNMVAQEWDAARTQFAQSELLALKAGSYDESLLSAGYLALVDVLQHPQDPTYEAKLEAVYNQLANENNGQEFRDQLETAKVVFSR